MYYKAWQSGLWQKQNTSYSAGRELSTVGKEGVQACISCHGEHGEGQFSTGVPRIAGLNKFYIIKQLQDFRRKPLRTRVYTDPIIQDYSKTPRVNVDLTVYTPGTRKNMAMNKIASRLSDVEMNQLASYYSQLSFVMKPIPAEFEVLARGEDLALRGKPEYGLPACISCHEKNSEGYEEVFPALVGQPPQYIISQINNWQNGNRDNDPLALMKNIAIQLTDGDKLNVATYLANLSYSVNKD